jgi:excisionase family DNA binding protein
MNNSLPSSVAVQVESPASDTLLTTQEVADFLRVSIKTVFNLRKMGLPYLQLGGAVRFDSQEVRAYLLKNRHLSSHRLRQKARQHAKAS